MANKTAPVVQTASGAVRGFWRGPGALDNSANPAEMLARGHAYPSPVTPAGKYAAFLGIPYAKAPVLDLRFAAPVPPEPWEGERPCVDYGPTPQREMGEDPLIPEPSIPGEETLNLNVFTPDPSPQAALPVLFYIHGGGYFAGSPASPWYDGRAFNRDGVVTVTASYRLGFDGFGDLPGAPANRGVLDWLAALKWVQENITAFGGDPAQVTIGGQSAGGGAALTLLGMEDAQDYFARVWSVSGALADIDPARAQATRDTMAEMLGVPATLEGFRSRSERDVSAAQKRFMAKAIEEVGGDAPELVQFGPVVDGDLVKRTAPDSLRLGVGAAKPLLLGATAGEFAMISSGLPRALDLLPKSLVAWKLGVRGGAGRTYVREVDPGSTRELIGDLITQRVFRVPVAEVAEVRGEAPTWIYSFNWTAPRWPAPIHCTDVPFWFDCLDHPYTEWLFGAPGAPELAAAMHAGIVDFVKTGSPGWPQAVSGTDPAMVLDGAPTGEVRTGAYRLAQHLAEGGIT